MIPNIKYILSLIYFLIFLLFLLFLLIFPSCDVQNTPSQIIHDTVYINSTQLLSKLKVDSVKVDSSYNDLTGNKMIDGIPAFVKGEQTKSRWAVEGYPHYAVFYFDSLVTINKIRLNLYKGDE